MSLKDYEADPDYFEFDEDNSFFAFPCLVCKYKELKMTEKPCCYCGHNCCADDEVTP